MKIQKVESSKPVFKPIYFTIELETHEEAVVFEHMLTCYKENPDCSLRASAKEMACNLHTMLKDNLIGLPEEPRGET